MSLLLVIGTALLMQTVGLSMALGTFLAGVFLQIRNIRYELELDIEPFKGLLLGLFFIAIGMSLNIGLIPATYHINPQFNDWLNIIKFIIMYYIARWFKENRADAQMFACYLSQAGEFAFVLFNIAFVEHILSPYLVDILKSIVAVSMIMTPFILIAYDNFILQKTKGIRKRS